MPSRRFSRRALLATVGSAIAATAGCNAPAESSETSPSNTTADAPDSTDEGTDSGVSDDREISLSGEDAWTTYGYEAGHSGYNPDAVGPADDPGMVWNSSVEGIYTLREPAVADGRVFVGSDQIMWAFDATSGDSEWQRNLGGMAHHFSPTYRDDTLYAVAKDASGVNSEAAGSVRALNPETGDRRWASSLPVTSTVAHDGDRLYVAAKADGNGYVQTLDPDSGDRGWRFDVPDASESYVTAVPTYADGTVYVAATKVDGDGSTTGTLYALDPESGDLDWTFDTESALSVAAVVANDRLYVAARDGTVHGLSLDGDEEWAEDVGSRVYTRPTYANGRLFVLTAADIVAFDDGGTELWRAASERTQMTGMSVAADTLYVGGEPLFALDVTDGSEIFDLPVGAYHGSYGAPVVVDDVMYAGICIKEEPGSLYDNYVRAYV